ncbi:MAG TPA: hypothetical protein VKB85_11770 [Propionibacteriaceae bacterium]|nr:hypothetical protein [Propionibacteriaceae bacterium]
MSRYGHLTVAGELGVVAPDELAAPNEPAAPLLLDPAVDEHRVDGRGIPVVDDPVDRGATAFDAKEWKPI